MTYVCTGYEQWSVACDGAWVGFFRLTAHETALLIFAASMVVSFTPDQWTLKKQIIPTHYIHSFYSVQMKSNLINKENASTKCGLV